MGAILDAWRDPHGSAGGLAANIETLKLAVSLNRSAIFTAWRGRDELRWKPMDRRGRRARPGLQPQVSTQTTGCILNKAEDHTLRRSTLRNSWQLSIAQTAEKSDTEAVLRSQRRWTKPPAASALAVLGLLAILPFMLCITAGNCCRRLHPDGRLLIKGGALVPVVWVSRWPRSSTNVSAWPPAKR
jgi:hypothetical protein